VKSMTDNIASIRQMSETLMKVAGSGGKFQEKLHVELAELTSALDVIAHRSQSHSEKLLSAQQQIDVTLADIRAMDSRTDELMTRLSQLDFATAEPNSVSRLQIEFKVIFALSEALVTKTSHIYISLFHFLVSFYGSTAFCFSFFLLKLWALG